MKTKIKKILITGSSGMIGTRLSEKLLEKGYKIIGFDKNKNNWRKDFNSFTIIGNLLNQKDFKKIPKDVDLIIHLAANPRVYDLVVSPGLALDNVVSTYNILDFARKSKIKKVMFASSREVYGNKEKITSKESDADFALCESTYSASKIAGESFVYAFLGCYNIDYIVFRFSNVYGMYDTSDRFIPILIRKMQKNQTIEIYGKDKILDFTYIDDCIDGIVKCIERFSIAKNNTFNIAIGKGEKLTDVAMLLKKNLSSKSKIIIRPNRTGEVIKYVADISKAKKMLNYKPVWTTKKGILSSIDWYLKKS